MKLLLRRPLVCGKRYTRGDLYIDGKFECKVLEDEDRELEKYPEKKITAETCIPRGTYNVVITMSNRFKRLLPLLENVPGFSGVRIHPGNTIADTEGCLLVGVEDDNNPDRVLMSRVTFDGIYKRIKVALDNGEKVEIEIK